MALRRPLAMTSRSGFFKHALAMGALCTAVIGAWARPAAADGTEPQTQPNDLPPIRWIVVERNARTRGGTITRRGDPVCSRCGYARQGADPGLIA